MAIAIPKVTSLLKPKHRWMQFSLRTVLVLVTLHCIALSLWVVPAEQQRRAISVISAVGGYAYADKPSAEALPKTLLRRWLPRGYFDDVVYVYLADNGPQDDALAHLRDLPSLTWIVANSPQVTDEGLAHLQGLKGLERLSLRRTQVTDAGLARLRGLTSLRMLDLGQTRVSDAGLAHLDEFNGLEDLYVDSTQVTAAGLHRLQSLQSLRWLIISEDQVTDAGLAQFRHASPGCQIQIRKTGTEQRLY